MAMGVNKMFNDGRMGQMPPHMAGAEHSDPMVDEMAMDPSLAGNWGQEFMQPPPGAMMMQPPPGMQGDWAAEMARHAQRCPHPQTACSHSHPASASSHAPMMMGPGPMMMAPGMPMMMGPGMMQPTQQLIPMRQQQVDVKAKEAEAAQKTAEPAEKTGDQWVDDYLQKAGENAEDWMKEFSPEMREGWAEEMEKYNEEGWADQYEEMLKGGDLGMKKDSAYPFEEDNPYMFHENPFEEGVELRAAGSLKEAALAFEAAVQKQEDHAQGWKHLGMTQADNEKDRHAVIALKHARNLAPQDRDILTQLGVSLTNEGQTEEALDVFRDWIGGHPMHGEFAKKAMAITGSMDEMANMGAEPEEEMVMDYFAKQDKETKRVIAVMEKCNQQGPDNEIHAVLGVLCHMAHDYDSAASHYQALLNNSPEKAQDSRQWNRLGAILANGGRNEDALVAYNRALDINPGFVRAYYNIGVSQSQMKNYDAAARTFLKALEIQGNDGKKGSMGMGMDIWDSLRHVLSCMGRQDLYDQTWKGDVSIFADFPNAAPAQ
eukprot:TRINITY_DN882_c0_g3_i1.p2 TRINITY_DN882_c0_g3~~TRINITY_DN882_c0_g3_i1.p2  ORF type:complete len:585 (+),score=273.21 TRINITY_DN882_c0_g3_i1:124-1755(+)